MFVILMDDQVISSQAVCQGCLMADHSGQPRSRQGQLCCGSPVRKITEGQPEQYQCQMGFRVANIG